MGVLHAHVLLAQLPAVGTVGISSTLAIGRSVSTPVQALSQIGTIYLDLALPVPVGVHPDIGVVLGLVLVDELLVGLCRLTGIHRHPIEGNGLLLATPGINIHRVVLKVGDDLAIDRSGLGLCKCHTGTQDQDQSEKITHVVTPRWGGSGFHWDIPISASHPNKG